MDAFKLILVSLVGWMNRQQEDAIDYLREETTILKEQQGSALPFLVLFALPRVSLPASEEA